MLLEIIVLALAIPIGFFLAYFTKEELKQARPFLCILTIVSVIITGWTAIISRQDIAFTSLFIAIVAFVSIKGKHLYIK